MRRGILLVLPCLLVLGACRSPRYVPVPVTRTEVRHTVSRDSVFLRDSVSVFQRGDTVFRDRWHIRWRDHWLTDTLAVRDTVPVVVPVERERTWAERTALTWFWPLVAVCVLVLGWRVGVRVLKLRLSGK